MARMAHRTAVELLRLITNSTRDLIKSTEQRVWQANHLHKQHPNDSANYWYHVRDTAEQTLRDAEQLRLLAQENIRQLEV